MILLDTHVLVWLASEPTRLSRRAATAIRTALTEGGIAIASITLWELAMLFNKGRLRAPGTVAAAIQEIVETTGVSVREMTPEIAALSVEVPPEFPADPADRLIAATARVEGLTLVTRDERIRASTMVRTLW